MRACVGWGVAWRSLNCAKPSPVQLLPRVTIPIASDALCTVGILVLLVLLLQHLLRTTDPSTAPLQRPTLASMMANTRSMPMDTPTAGTSFPLNMPTSVSYRPPAAIEPTFPPCAQRTRAQQQCYEGGCKKGSWLLQTSTQATHRDNWLPLPELLPSQGPLLILAGKATLRVMIPLGSPCYLQHFSVLPVTRTLTPPPP